MLSFFFFIGKDFLMFLHLFIFVLLIWGFCLLIQYFQPHVFSEHLPCTRPVPVQSDENKVRKWL